MLQTRELSCDTLLPLYLFYPEAPTVENLAQNVALVSLI